MEIKQTILEPDKNALWLNNGTLKYFSNEGWQVINNDYHNVQGPKLIKRPGKIEDLHTFDVNNTPEGNKENLLLASDILFDKVETVRILGTINGIEYNTIGIYSDGYITATLENEYVVFNVNFNDGSIKILTEVSIDKLLPHIILKVGDTEEVKLYNIEHLIRDEFFVHLDYGFGVGTFSPILGGFAHITNAYGNEAFYNIGVDGSVMVDREYIKPNEPYTITITSEEIGVALKDTKASLVYKAGEIVVTGGTGPITYTRTADSTANIVYFTDNRKDGKMTLLTYNNNNKTITYSLGNMAIDKATTTKLGGVYKGTSVADSNTGNLTSVGDTLNNLLKVLRDAGIITK